MGDGWKAARRAATTTHVDVERAVEVLGTLRQQGWTHRRIVDHSGVSPSTLTKIAGRKVSSVAESTFERLLALVEPPGDRLPLRERFDPEPLICAISILGIGAENSDRATGSSWQFDAWLRTTINRWRSDGGLSWQQADLWATRLGLHPADRLLWGDQWWTVDGELEAV